MEKIIEITLDLFPEISEKFVREQVQILMKKENSTFEKTQNILINQIIKMNGNYPKESRKGHFICCVCNRFNSFFFFLCYLGIFLMTKYVLNVPHVKILIIVVGVCS
jgi:hypothetical protein